MRFEENSETFYVLSYTADVSGVVCVLNQLSHFNENRPDVFCAKLMLKVDDSGHVTVDLDISGVTLRLF